MKKMTWMRGALVLTAMLGASTALAADHLDGPAAVADPAADITDLFTWVDGANTVLILNVTPGATTASKFSNAVQYVFHTGSAAAFGASTASTNIICTFDTSQNISCWVGTSDYVTGNASVSGGITSTSGDVKVFAGLRDDPFFFNLGGFHDAEADVEAATGVTTTSDGCPNNLPAATVMALDKDIAGSNHGAGAAVDFFSPSASYSGNVLSIVLSVKTSLVTSGGPIMAVWASTNKAM
jgi:hypothetical protein